MHIEPLAEEMIYVEPEPVVQEPGEEHVVQQPPEEPQYEEQQPGYDYVPEAATELTPDPHEQGRHPKH